jgi:transposase
MVGSKKGHKQGDWAEVDLKNAVRAVVVENCSQAAAARKYSVPRQTLRRHLKLVQAGKGVEKRFGRPPVLSEEQETELSTIIQDMESRLYGLTPGDIRSIVFQYCERNKVAHPFNVDREMAGKKWFKAFLKRNGLAVRVPEATSIQRASGFNAAKVSIFFETLKKILFEADEITRKVPPENIFNVDESGFTVCQKPHKVVTKKGKRAVGTLTSCERGENVTTVCCISAAGVYVPPLFIFPRVKMKASLMNGSPVGSIGLSNKSGWINNELFTRWFDLFLSAVQPQARSQPVLLIMDGHTSHTRNLELIDKARENNVIILILPSHCTHRLQPLDISLFKSLNWYYDEETRTWLREHGGRAVAEEDIASIFNKAYGKAGTIKNAESGFRKAGIHPYNQNVFQPEDFLGADATDKPRVATTQPGVPNTAPDVSTSGPDNTAPGVSNTAPGVSATEPDNTAPGVSNTTPDVSTTAPGVSTTGPDNTAPGVSNTAPGVSTTEHGVSTSETGVLKLMCTAHDY